MPESLLPPEKRTRLNEVVRELLDEVAPTRAEELSPRISAALAEALTTNIVRATASDVEPAAEGEGVVPDTLTVATDQIARATNLPFPEFTAKIITGTFDAIIGATIHQMEAYAQLVANLASTIQQFESSNVSDADIDRFLAENYPDGSGKTAVRDDFTFPSVDALAKVYDDIVSVRLKGVFGTGTDQVAAPAALAKDGQGVLTQTSFVKDTQVDPIRAGVRRHLAKSNLDQLRGMARDGMARIVITDGRILTKLTFNVSATTQQATSSSDFEVKQSQWNIGGGAARRWWNIGGGGTRARCGSRRRTRPTSTR
jgi:hypothetical protein